jgi:hypothetical protein
MKTMHQTLRLFSVLIGLWASSQTPLSAVNEKGDWPWNLKLNGWQDREVAEELGTGWFLNVGPTGLRARITREHPQYLTIKYVFKKSPAHGLVNINDIVVGANGKRLTVPHTFGRGSRGRGTWEGPMLDMSKLIEDSQGGDGKLELIVWPGGDKSKEKSVTVQIEPVGRFSPTWPYNCPRSDKLMLDLCDFLAEDYKRAGKFDSRVHGHSAALLALMAGGGKKHERLVRNIMSEYGSKRYDPVNGNGFPAWNYGHDGIVMGEYYLLTKDRSLLPAIESLTRCYVEAQTPESGGYSHKPYPAIQRRIAEGGPKGYGAMALPGGLAMLAMSLFKEAGLDYAAPAYERVHQAYLRSAGPNGAIGYGFEGWDHAVIRLTGEDAKMKGSPKGIGFLCPYDMTGIKEFEIVWPTQKDPRYKPTDWLKKEAETNRVFDFGGAKRVVVRTMPLPEPKRPYKHNGQPCDHYARTGCGALAHSIGNAGNQSWNYFADLLATGCAKSPNSLLDGHASTHMHVLWGSLGAALADPEDFREYLDGIKWWFIMAQAHDGSFVVMPGRDYASSDHVYGTRVFPSACAALILSVKEKRLQITGAPRGTGGKNAQSSPSSSSVREARQLIDGKRGLLDESLILALAELSQAGQLQPLPMSLSKARAKVSLVKVGSDARLTFQEQDGGAPSSFALAELDAADHVMLARLVAHLKPDDAESQARAGIYLELSGDTRAADEYYRKAGTRFEPLLNELFQ